MPSWNTFSLYLHSSPFCQDAYACAVEPMTRILSSEIALSQSLSFPVPLDKGNAGSGNEIVIRVEQFVTESRSETTVTVKESN